MVSVPATLSQSRSLPQMPPMLQFTANAPPPPSFLKTPQREKRKKEPFDHTQFPHLPASFECSIVVRVPRPARRRRLRAAVCNRRGRAVVPSAGARRRRPGRRRGCRVGAPAARPGRGGGGIQRTGRGRIERAWSGSVERRAWGRGTQTARGRRVICGRRRAPGIVAGAWRRRRDAVCWSLGSCAPCGVTATAGVSWCLGAE